jgi:hypothetical protein
VRFKEFLQESSHRNEIDIQEAKKLLETHCKDAMKNFGAPMWRGSRNMHYDAMLIHGEADSATGRKSANTSNYYTVLMDKFLPYFGYPKRSKSIICANNSNKEYAYSFGNVYAIFPFDNVSIGVCESYDLWTTSKFTIGNDPRERGIEEWNTYFKMEKFSSDSWEYFKESLEEAMDEESPRAEKLRKYFGPPEKIESVFRKAYSPENLKLELTNSDNIDNVEDSRECWIGGKCIALAHDVWKEMLKETGHKDRWED